MTATAPPIASSATRSLLLIASVIGAGTFIYGVTLGDAIRAWQILLVNFPACFHARILIALRSSFRAEFAGTPQDQSDTIRDPSGPRVILFGTPQDQE